MQPIGNGRGKVDLMQKVRSLALTILSDFAFLRKDLLAPPTSGMCPVCV